MPFARADWLVRKWLECTPRGVWRDKIARQQINFGPFFVYWKNKLSFSVFVLRAKTIIHLSVGESGGYSRIKRRHIERSLYIKRSVAKVRNFFP